MANSTVLAGGAVVFFFTLLFLLPWWNRYLGITNEGWYQFFGKQILQGRLPYRDFYMFVPPGQSLLMGALTSIFGDRVVVPELFGLVGAMVMALTLYVWMVRLFPVFWATLATVCTTAIYLRSSGEPLSGLQLNCNLLPLLALAAASFALDRNAGSGGLLLTGLFAGIAFVTKQTAGVAIFSLGIIVPILIAVRSHARAGLRAATFFAIGWAVPVCLTCFWLLRNGAFNSFVDDVYVHGPSSKGHLSSLLARQAHAILGNRYQQLSVAVAVTVVLFAGLLLRFMHTASDGGYRPLSKRREAFVVCGFGVVAVALTVCAQHWPGPMQLRLHRLDFFFTAVPCYVGELGSLALLIFYASQLVRRRLTANEEQLLLAAWTSFVCAYLFSFSWPTGKMILPPAFPFVVAFIFSRLPCGKFTSLAKAAAVVLAFVCIEVMAGSKMREPYFWADWLEGDALRATVALDFPELRGMRVTPETASFLRRIVSDIQEHSRPGEPIAEFPTMPILYTLAHRAPMTFAYIHYIDVTPDYIYRQDISRLEQSPPAVIVFISRSESEIREGEVNFRNGRRSGERDLWESLQALACKYQVVDVLQTPNTNQRVEVWVRQSVAESRCASSNLATR
ncbi:MAG: glycosyltransferase family 39 protein [Candidatus Sulfotelmatobacter sp.]